MNDTPTQTIADALLLLSLGNDNEIGKDASERLMKLERENAALREKFMFAESEIILLREDREELRELAARMAKEMRETDHEFCSLVDYDNLQNKI